jgi:glucose-6-phosphate 1-epimerase
MTTTRMTPPIVVPAALNAHFGINGILRFEERPAGMIVAVVTSPACTAELYLQGAHLTAWQPKGQSPMLFLSERTKLEPGTPIRGGIPVVFPWFGQRSEDLNGNMAHEPQTKPSPNPMHGFARTQPWTLGFAGMMGSPDDPELRLAFTLGPTEESRALGYDQFHCGLEFTLGRSLRVQFTVANLAAQPLVYEQALHTYLHVGSVEQATLTGLTGTEYLDKRDGGKRKRQEQSPMRFTKTLDQVYLDTEATCTVHDPVLERRLQVAKSGSRSTVVWNPWAELAITMPDMSPEGWRTMLAVETANTGQSRVTLAPNSTHVMAMELSAEALTS